MELMKALQPISAAVLAGGLSSRMGTDKALLPIVPGGEPLLSIVVDRLKHVSDDVLIVAPDRQGYDAFATRVVPDLIAGGGALVGIHAALSHAEYEHCIVVGCDMPFLSQPLIEHMAGEPRDYDVLIPHLPGSSRQGAGGLVYHTLHAIYGRRCLPAIEDQLRAGKRQVIGFFAQVDVRTIAVETVIALDPPFLSFFNANTPETLARAREILTAAREENGEHSRQWGGD
jgi:molybdopterin-guanine dinucleotide biosynthesis protein A